jgi:hypothetical protein
MPVMMQVAMPQYTLHAPLVIFDHLARELCSTTAIPRCYSRVRRAAAFVSSKIRSRASGQVAISIRTYAFRTTSQATPEHSSARNSCRDAVLLTYALHICKQQDSGC